MSTTTRTPILRSAMNWTIFLVLSFALWITSAAVFGGFVHPYVDAEMAINTSTVFAIWFVATCLATWAIGQRY